MEKEELISTLKEKVGNTNFSDRSFATYVENIIPQDGTEPDDAFFERHSNIIKSLTGQMRADISSALSNALPDEVQRYLEKNPKYVEDFIAKRNSKSTEPPTDDKYKALLDEINGLKNSIESQKAEQNNNLLRESATRKLTESGIGVNKGLWDDAINSIAIPNGATAEDVFNLAKAKYEEKCKKYAFDGGKPFGSKGQGGSQETDKAVSDFFARKKAKMKK